MGLLLSVQVYSCWQKIFLQTYNLKLIETNTRWQKFDFIKVDSILFYSPVSLFCQILIAVSSTAAE